MFCHFPFCDSLAHQIHILFLSFLSLSPHFASFPCTFPPWGCHLPFPPVDRISAAVTSTEAAPPCFLPSLQNSLPRSLLVTLPPSLSIPSSSLLASISFRAELCVCVCVCNPDSLQPNWTVADFKHHGNNFCQHQGSLFLPFPAFPFYVSPPAPLLFSILCHCRSLHFSCI